MRRYFRVLLTAFLGLNEAAFAAQQARIYYTGNRQGEVEPCGCQVNQLGGLDRLQNFLTKEGKRNKFAAIFFADAGDSFFSARTISEFRIGQERLRAKTVADAYRKLGIQVVAPGERDFADGLEPLKDLEKASGATFVSSNLQNESEAPLFAGHVVKSVGDWKVLFVSASPENLQLPKGVKAIEPARALRKVFEGLKDQKFDQVVLLSQLEAEAEKALLVEFPITGVIRARSLDFLQEPIYEKNTWIVQPQMQGQQIGMMDFTKGSKEKPAHRLVDLGKDFQKPVNSITKLMDKYRNNVRELAVAEAKSAPEVKSDKPFVAHPVDCKMCHAKQYDFWANTKHASAYLVLYAKNHHFDAECIGCHTLGFQSPNGFQKAAIPMELDPSVKVKKDQPFVETLMTTVFKGDKQVPLDSREDPKRYAALKKRYHAELNKLEDGEKIKRIFLGVQCEHCHGNRNGHPDPSVATLKKVNEASCKECHVPPHAKPYDPKTFAKVACPLSSQH